MMGGSSVAPAPQEFRGRGLESQPEIALDGSSRSRAASVAPLLPQSPPRTQSSSSSSLLREDIPLPDEARTVRFHDVDSLPYLIYSVGDEDHLDPNSPFAAARGHGPTLATALNAALFPNLRKRQPGTAAEADGGEDEASAAPPKPPRPLVGTSEFLVVADARHRLHSEFLQRTLPRFFAVDRDAHRYHWGQVGLVQAACAPPPPPLCSAAGPTAAGVGSGAKRPVLPQWRTSECALELEEEGRKAAPGRGPAAAGAAAAAARWGGAGAAADDPLYLHDYLLHRVRRPGQDGKGAALAGPEGASVWRADALQGLRPDGSRYARPSAVPRKTAAQIGGPLGFHTATWAPLEHTAVELAKEGWLSAHAAPPADDPAVPGGALVARAARPCSAQERLAELAAREHGLAQLLLHRGAVWLLEGPRMPSAFHRLYALELAALGAPRALALEALMLLPAALALGGWPYGRGGGGGAHRAHFAAMYAAALAAALGPSALALARRPALARHAVRHWQLACAAAHLPLLAWAGAAWRAKVGARRDAPRRAAAAARPPRAAWVLLGPAYLRSLLALAAAAWATRGAWGGGGCWGWAGGEDDGAGAAAAAARRDRWLLCVLSAAGVCYANGPVVVAGLGGFGRGGWGLPGPLGEWCCPRGCFREVLAALVLAALVAVAVAPVLSRLG